MDELLQRRCIPGLTLSKQSRIGSKVRIPQESTPNSKYGAESEILVGKWRSNLSDSRIRVQSWINQSKNSKHTVSLGPNRLFWGAWLQNHQLRLLLSKTWEREAPSLRMHQIHVVLASMGHICNWGRHRDCWQLLAKEVRATRRLGGGRCCWSCCCHSVGLWGSLLFVIWSDVRTGASVRRILLDCLLENIVRRTDVFRQYDDLLFNPAKKLVMFEKQLCFL